MSREGLGSSPGAPKRLHCWTRDPREKGVEASGRGSQQVSVVRKGEATDAI